LVKAFDTIQHQLLFKILQKYGLPNTLIQVIKKIYSNCFVEFKHDNKKSSIEYTTGVQQGDNMSPILFLFVMQAFMDTLKIDTPPAEFRYFPEHKNGNLASLNGRLIGQPTASKGNLFHFNKSFYVDDSVFLY